MSRSTRAIAALVAPALVVTVLAGCAVHPSPEPTPLPRIPGTAEAASLSTFDGCEPLLEELHERSADVLSQPSPPMVERGLSQLAPGAARTFAEDAAGARSPMASGVAGPSDEAAAGGWGGTNVQEHGVDEPDTVKTNGALVLAVAAGELRVVDVSGDAPEARGSLPVAEGAQLLVDGATALVLASSLDGSATEVVAVDVSDPAQPTVRERVWLDGWMNSARMVDGMVRVVTTTGGPNIAFDVPTVSRAAETVRRRNIEKIRATRIDDWLPRARVEAADGRLVAERPVVDCDDVFVPAEPVGTTMVNVVSIDLRGDRLEPAGGASVVGAGETVYASAERLYVTSTTWEPSRTGTPVTDVHQFSITGREPASYLASGRVAGTLLNQFSMSEHEGLLRVAVTGFDQTTTASSVVVLGRRDGELVEVGRVDGLGRGEQIRSVRFMGDVGYVVTFRQTDPLYTIELSDPAAPRAAGELKIPGYSSYLHPLGEDRLVGIGQDATLQGRTTGLQLALFDVSDLAAPRQLQKWTLPNASSAAETDHHAFLWWAEAGLAVVPLVDWNDGGFTGAAALAISDEAIRERARISHAGGTPIERFLVIDGQLVSVSAAGLAVADPSTFTEQAFVPFG